MSTESDSEITILLDRWSDGDDGALNELLPKLYSELHRTAGAYMAQQRAGHTLQPTALINEALMRMHAPSETPFRNRSHFLAAAAQAMRHLLIDHARKKNADKRFDPADRVTLIEGAVSGGREDLDVLALEEALARLKAVSPRQEQIVVLRYFGGMSQEEVAEVLGVSVPTVARDWRVARMLLREWLSEDDQ
ncbi:MAG: sigma-70 family RNA polymerase sigma factor [Xanthomonadales bacterium]|nr:sigma-70 family RNA polymerase sigma factor [Xanthomonadales bacterium]